MPSQPIDDSVFRRYMHMCNEIKIFVGEIQAKSYIVPPRGEENSHYWSDFLPNLGLIKKHYSDIKGLLDDGPRLQIDLTDALEQQLDEVKLIFIERANQIVRLSDDLGENSALHNYYDNNKSYDEIQVLSEGFNAFFNDFLKEVSTYSLQYIVSPLIVKII